MGSWSLINSPSLLGLIPLILYLILVFKGYKATTAVAVGLTTGCILTGQSISSISSMLAKATGSFLGIIGLIIMLGSGLGYVMTKSGVAKTIVYWIVNRIGVNNEKKGIIVTMICSLVIVALLGTLAGGNAIIAPIIIPVVAAVGITPSTVGIIFQAMGETGLIWGPFTPPVIGLMAITGLSYGKMMIWAAIPYGVIWIIITYFVAQRIQKSTKAKGEKYENVEIAEEFTPTASQKRTTVIFLVSFLLFIIYGIITKQGTNYVIVFIILLALILGVSSKMKLDTIIGEMAQGMGKMTEMYLLFILLEPFINLIVISGGFEALSKFLLNIFPNPNSLTVMMMGSLVGGFGVDGAVVAQLKITNDLFIDLVNKIGLPMEMWAIALIVASRITTNVYPTANMVGQMGIARSKNIKAMLISGWCVSMAILVYIFLWSFIGQKIFF